MRLNRKWLWALSIILILSFFVPDVDFLHAQIESEEGTEALVTEFDMETGTDASETNIETDLETEFETEPEINLETEFEIEPEINLETEFGTEPEINIETEIIPAEVQTESESAEPVQETEPMFNKTMEQDTDSMSGMISGYIWADANEDGVKDITEEKIAGVKVFLFAADDKTQLLNETVTDLDGEYQFSDLAAGVYCTAVEAQVIDETEYLPPIMSLQAGVDNVFDVDWESDPVRSYADDIIIEESGFVSNVNAGIRFVTRMEPMDGTKKYEVRKGEELPGTYIGEFDILQDAVDICDNTPHIIIAKANDILDKGVVIDNKKITLTSETNEQYTIYQNKLAHVDERDSARHFEVIYNSESSLTLENIILEGTGTATGNQRNGGVRVGWNATLIVGEGAVIQKCYWDNGGGIKFEDGIVEINGGSIINNKAQDDGGGIWASSAATITINGGRISENMAGKNGGGIYLQDKSGNKIISNDGLIEKNEAGENGGGIYIQNGTLTIDGGSITGNLAKENGGGVFRSGDASNGITFTAGSIGGDEEREANEAKKDGGGIYIQNGMLTIEQGASITGNVGGINGGGVFAKDSTLKLNGGKIIKNIAHEGDGGGIRGSGAAITIKAGEISQNEAKHGAGISANRSDSASTVNMEDGNISGNVTAERGGGVNIDGSGTRFNMSGGKITDNTAEIGGGLLAGGTAEIYITQGEISNNVARGFNGGGGILAETGSLLKLKGSEIPGEDGTGEKSIKIKNNKTQGTQGTKGGNGGGIYAFGNNKTEIEYTDVIGNKSIANGGGLCIQNDTETIVKNVNITDNVAVDDSERGEKLGNSGGGIWGNKITVNISNCHIESNQATQGAGISLTDSSTGSIDGASSIINNIAAESGGGIEVGGGMAAGSGTTLTMTTTEVSENQAKFGAGVMVSGSSTVTMSQGKIDGNTASVGNGGGLYSQNSEIKLNDAQITNNKAADEEDGGGIRLETAQLELSKTKITGNAAGYGGGISANENSNITMKNASAISGNTAIKRGGGVNIDIDTVFTMEDGKINGNSAETGGGVIASVNSRFDMKGGEILKNETSSHGGGVRMESSVFNMMNAVVSANQAGEHGGGVYLTADSELNMSGSSTVSTNTAKEDGGGVYTENLSYTLTIPSGKYINIKVNDSAEISGNTSRAVQEQPKSAEEPLYFNIELLDNNEINYYPASVEVIYDPNGGESRSGAITKTYGTDVKITALSPGYSDMRFTAPSTTPEYIFKGWNTKADGTGDYYEIGQEIKEFVDGRIVLYAMWGPQPVISGYVFWDTTRNNLYDEEEGISERIVTLYKLDDDGAVIEESAVTEKTTSDGFYTFSVDIGEKYKVFVKPVDQDGDNALGETGFIVKGETDRSSHVYQFGDQMGYSDPIQVSRDKNVYSINAGYAAPFPSITGVNIYSKPWMIIIIFSCIFIAGLFLTNRRARIRRRYG